MVTPRVQFCWLCGNKLRGDSFVEREVDGHTRILHNNCSSSLDAEEEEDLDIKPAFGDDEDEFLTDTDYLEDFRDDEDEDEE